MDMNGGVVSALIVLAGAAAAVVMAAGQAPPDRVQLEAMTARFAPTDISPDVSALPENERQALRKLVAASRLRPSPPTARLLSTPGCASRSSR